MPFQHYLTYQHNVQRFFRDHQDKYDGIIIPMSIATSFPSGTYGFVRALQARDPKKEYAIDPRTPLFQKKWNRENVRDPHKRMASELGGPFATNGLTSKLGINDFKDEKVLDAVVKSCLDFQKRFCTRQEDKRKLKKYKRLLGVSELSELGEPQFLIPPYFEFQTRDDEWYKLSVRCVERAKAIEVQLPLRPVVHFRKWTEVADWNPVCDDLRKLKCSAAWLYPNSFKEAEADKDELAGYVRAVTAFCKKGVKPFALFGGYFAILLAYENLAGFSNGIGYGEWRDSGYHKGGSAETRVYILKLHRYLDAVLAQSLIDKDPEYFGNDSDLISECIEAERPLSSLTSAECLDHFMECRRREIVFVTSNPKAKALEEITETLTHLKAVGPLESDKFGTPLKRWQKALE